VEKCCKLNQELDVEALEKMWHGCRATSHDWFRSSLGCHWKNRDTMQDGCGTIHTDKVVLLPVPSWRNGRKRGTMLSIPKHYLRLHSSVFLV